MFKIFKRTLAYFIDMMVVLIIVQNISGIPIINKNLDKYSKTYDNYIEILEEYSDIKLKLSNYYQDNKI